MYTIEIKLGGKSCQLRPAFTALTRIEQQLGTGFFALARKTAQGMMTLEEMAVVISCCTDGLSTAFVQKNLVQDGLGQAQRAVAALFTIALKGETSPIQREEFDAMLQQFSDGEE
jgi:hypothetical protein